jgi:hypothetical protein
MRCSAALSCIFCGPCICLWISLTACFCPSRLRRRSFTSEDKARFERRQFNAPRPCPVRKRALTIPLPDVEQSKGQKILDQSASPLFKLPLELREVIYTSLLGNNKLHIIRKNRRLGHLTCKSDEYRDCPATLDGWTRELRRSCLGNYNRDGIWIDDAEPTDGDIVPFLQSCRQAYSEAISILYSTNTFSFHDLDCIRYFSASVLPMRLDTVRSIDICWQFRWPSYDTLAQRLLAGTQYPPHDEASWEDCWRIISGMKGLKRIEVVIQDSVNIADPVKEQSMLEPLRQVTHVPDFTIVLDWGGQSWQGAPFRVIRPEPILEPESA